MALKPHPIELVTCFTEHVQAVNKDAIVRLAEMYVEKAKQRFPDALQTKKCETVVLGIRNSPADKQPK
jgi:hypothetical protein